MDPWRTIRSLSYAQIRDLQDRKLRHLINTHVYPFSPFYRRSFDQHGIRPGHIRSVGDLKLLPFSSKLDLVNKENPQQFKDFILQPDQASIKKYWPKTKLLAFAVLNALKGKSYVQERLGREYRPVFMTFTTGTTNAPVPFVYSRYDIDNLHLSGSRMLDLFNIAPDERILNVFPFAPHLAFWQTFFGALEANRFALSTGGGRAMGTDGNMLAMSRVKPSVLLGVPSFIYHLLRYAREKGQDLSYIKKVVLGAAKVTVPYKQKLAQILKEQGAENVKIFGTYGFTEARCAWAECPSPLERPSGYHLYPDKEIFEVIDPATGAVQGEGGDGELVYTALDARASVVLRYRTGDFVHGGVRYGKCAYCGRMMLLLSSDIERLSDSKELNLSKVKGTLVNLNHFGDAFSEIPQIDEWQIEIRKHNNDPYEVDEMVVYLTTKGHVDQDVFSQVVRDKLVGNTEVAPNEILFIPLAEMVKRLELETANKAKRIVDARPKA